MPLNKETRNQENNGTAHLNDEHTEKRIREHLMNEGDTISEEDISKVKTNIGTPAMSPEEDAKENIPQNEDKSSKDDSDPRIESTWNVLEE